MGCFIHCRAFVYVKAIVCGYKECANVSDAEMTPVVKVAGHVVPGQRGGITLFLVMIIILLSSADISDVQGQLHNFNLGATMELLCKRYSWEYYNCGT